MTQVHVKPVRVLIVDDHPMVAEGIEALLETFEDITVVGTLSNGREAVEQVEALQPDVILLDLNMPELSGLTATEMILEQRPSMRILILSMHSTPEYISTAMEHGARGYILKDVPTDEIKLAIDKVMAGDTYMCTGSRAALQPRASGARDILTSREQTILLKLAQGKSNRELADELEISVHTVETHRRNIKRKLGISSTAGLTRYAMEHGVLQGTGKL